MNNIVILFLCTVWSGAYIIFLMTIQKLNLHQCHHKKEKKHKRVTEVYSLDTERKIKNLCDEITTLKSYITKHKESLRNIVRKLPFKGEEWMQEYIREDVDDMLKRADEQQSEESEDINEPEVNPSYNYERERHDFNLKFQEINNNAIQRRLDEMFLSTRCDVPQELRMDN